MRLPSRRLAQWADEIIAECYVSREARRDQIGTWKSYYYAGRSDGAQARYNRCYSHVDRLNSMLFSPVDVRFSIEYDAGETKETMDLGTNAGRHLNREFHRTGCDTAFAEAVNMALVKGSMFVKALWGHDGPEPWLVHPELFGVLREDIGDLDRQEAFVHTSYLTKSQFARLVTDHPDRNEILKEVDASSKPGKDLEADESFFHQVIMGGTQAPVQTSTPQGTGQVTIVTIPAPVLDPKVASRLIRLDELWVQDTARDDYTTVRMVNPGILVEGKYRRRNLSGVKGEHPFTKVCPNEVDGFFWGTSELTQIYRLQDQLNDQVTDLNRMVRLKADPPRALTGFSGITQEKYKVLSRPRGYISEENPNAKVQSLAEEIPEQMFVALRETVGWFDDVAGFSPISMGQGEQGVRAGVHAQTLNRNATPRLRDRALLVERQCVDFGSFVFALLQEKDAQVFSTENQNKFFLKQLPDGYRIEIDSHTSSPVFVEDAMQKAVSLARMGAIGPEELIWLMHPPHEETLIIRAKEKAAAQAQFLRQHPEIALKQAQGKKK